MFNERRGSGRFFPVASIRIRIGRRDGVIMNLSRRGTRVRHEGALKVAEAVNVAIESDEGNFVSRARVLSCRAMPVKTPGDPLTFETRCAFESPSPEAMAILNRLLGR